MKRVCVFVNKFWEADAVMSALLNETIRDPALGWPSKLNQPRIRMKGKPPGPRAVYAGKDATTEVWCVSDFLEASAPSLQSSTEEKARLVAPFLKDKSFDALIAVGTAGFPNGTSDLNGSVAAGTNVFIHNGHPNGTNPLSNWTGGPFDTVLTSTLSPSQFHALFDYGVSLLFGFVRTPNGGNGGTVLVNPAYLSLGDVNVTDYKEYDAKDAETVKSFGDSKSTLSPVSLETTHGLLRALGPSNFLFLSGLTDRLGTFNSEVNAGQNFAAAFNAGVVLSAVLARIGDAAV